MPPANTTNGYPYPLGTDPVSDGDDAIKNLAQAVDTRVGVAAGGSATVVHNGQLASLTVTFPAGRFVRPPRAYLTPFDPTFTVGVGVSGSNINIQSRYIPGVPPAGFGCIVYWLCHDIP